MTAGRTSGDEEPAGTLKSRWEERASQKGATLQGVLYRGFGESLNQYLHEWHVWAVTKQLLPRLPRNALLLDLGCGYGRIRRHIIDARPDLRVVGADFSESYCRLHAQSFNSAETVCADIRHLPFAPRSFDGVVGVTALMYLPRAERPRFIHQILTTLKSSGYALFIDPGLEFMRLARLGMRSTRSTPTGGEGFMLDEYRRLGTVASCPTVAMGGLPWFTVSLPLLYLLRRSDGALRAVLRRLQPQDFANRSFLRYSLQRWVLLGPM